MNNKNNYTEQLEHVIKQMLKPLKDIPLNLVIEALCDKKITPFEFMTFYFIYIFLTNNNENFKYKLYCKEIYRILVKGFKEILLYKLAMKIRKLYK